MRPGGRRHEQKTHPADDRQPAPPDCRPARRQISGPPPRPGAPVAGGGGSSPALRAALRRHAAVLRRRALSVPGGTGTALTPPGGRVAGLRLWLRPGRAVPGAVSRPGAGGLWSGGVLFPRAAAGALRCRAGRAAHGPHVGSGPAAGGGSGGKRPSGRLPAVSAGLPEGVRLRAHAAGAGGHALADAGAYRGGPPRGCQRGP